MTLRVNLILEHERRSAALVSLNAVVFALGLLIVGGLGLAIGQKMIRIRDLNRQHTEIQNVMTELIQREKEEKQRDSLLAEVEAYDEELSFWLRARPRWSQTLYAIAQKTPGSIQIERLRLQESTLTREGRLGRVAQMALQSRVETETPEKVIGAFHMALARLSGDMDSAPEDFQPLAGAPGRAPSHGFRLNLRFSAAEERQ